MIISSDVACWYVVYTKSRWEKKVFDRLTVQGIEAYVPLQKKLKQWSDRKKWVEEPMIRCYAFVKIVNRQYFDVLLTPGVVCFLFFLRKPAVIPEEQIQTLKNVEKSKFNVELSIKQFKPGQKIEVIGGPLQGTRGELIKLRGKKRVLLRIDYLEESMLVDIAPEYLKVIDQ